MKYLFLISFIFTISSCEKKDYHACCHLQLGQNTVYQGDTIQLFYFENEYVFYRKLNDTGALTQTYKTECENVK